MSNQSVIYIQLQLPAGLPTIKLHNIHVRGQPTDVEEAVFSNLTSENNAKRCKTDLRLSLMRV